MNIMNKKKNYKQKIMNFIFITKYCDYFVIFNDV